MQDVRIRTGVAALLTITSFVSLSGAVAAFIWWLVFTKKTCLRDNRVILPSVLVIGVFSIILELTSGGGVSYFFRMLIIILLGAWLLQEQKEGDFFSLGTWLFGNRTGFELGMIAEMGLYSLDMLKTDFDHIRTASRLKGMGWGTRNLIPAGLILIHRALNRAEETAETLADRGYTHGGSMVPVFITTRMDLAAGCAALCAALLGIIPVSEFFILS